MSDTREQRRARVERVVAMGRRVADPADALGREAREALAVSSGLSPEGVALALSDHLEIDPAPRHLDALLDTAGSAPRCHVVLAANVCTAALRAIACAVAAAPRVVVRPSRRDPVLAAILARALASDDAFLAAGGVIALADRVDPAAGDELHVYGSNETVTQLTAALDPRVVVRAHGTGLGVAVIEAGAALGEAAEALSRDVVPFDQRGCLSPRAALVEGDAARAEAFAEALDRALSSLSSRVPRGPLDGEARAAIARYRASLQAAGAVWEGLHHLIGLDPGPRALLLPPAARVVHAVPAGATSAPALIAPWAGYLTAVGGVGALAGAIHALAPLARRARLGEMQRPPLDGPVDLRRR